MKVKRKRVSFGRLELIKSSGAGCKEFQSEIKKNNCEKIGPNPKWENYHYSYAEFIHHYVEHINKIRHSKNSYGNSKTMKLFKAKATDK